MNTFNSLSRLNDVIKAAKTHCIFLGHNISGTGYHDRMLPIVLVNFEHALDIPAHGLIPASTVNQIHYDVRKFLTVFRYGEEFCGEEGKGMYGIGMYEERTRGSWHCDSILFSESSCKPLLVKGRDAALQIAAEEVRSHDKSRARENEDAIVELGLIEAPVLNAILEALLRAEPGTAPATIGIRTRRIQLLLEGDDGGGRYLSVPEAGFVCRDQAAGMILNQIVYAIDDARRAHRQEPERERVFELTAV